MSVIAYERMCCLYKQVALDPAGAILILFMLFVKITSCSFGVLHNEKGMVPALPFDVFLFKFW